MPRKTDKLTIRIDPAVKEALREVAEDEHRSVANMVEVLVLNHCNTRRIPVKLNLRGKEK